MSQDTPASDHAAPSAAVPAPRPAPAPVRAPAPRRGGSLALAVVLALIAVGGSAYVGWRQWRQEQGSADDSRAVAALQARVGTLEGTLDTLGSERSSLRQRLADADQVNRSLREELLGQAERLRNIEDAVTKLSEKSLSGHDTMLLDETESLLRMAGQRYLLFHDAEGAAAAYALADQSLAAVNDGAFSGLRQSIQAEREALARSQPQTRDAQLATLGRLRDGLAQLPLKPLDATAAAPADDAWSRIRRALAGVVSVQRDNGAPLAVADARFARELAALDLAQAQAALLAYDSEAAQAALRRADADLAGQFDAADASVRQARGELAALLANLKPAAPVQLGAALAELRNLRAVHALKPAEAPGAGAANGPSAAPAASSSAAHAEAKP
ncbi:uroporphyrinogen-III C-methyltransferase [Frateuria sp. Soil773]|uniref:uroporphyrinogen-III C-methyltransferase n=1 Tax=Frateuria sp. Soil773 TaxID=1736407 RepID=UPI0009E6B355|nr:uroporphyrinogen-III C-methyltransferase [Frateuria sp. Soil773]